MGVRLLVMCSILIVELGLGISGCLGIASCYPYQRFDEGGIAGMVMIIAGILVSWMLTMAFFLRKSSRAKASRIVSDAKNEAARIISEASDKAMALCSLDAGKCRQCGNPRTGKFCPKCGAAAAT